VSTLQRNCNNVDTCNDTSLTLDIVLYASLLASHNHNAASLRSKSEVY
jgi:hypothetical protein